MLGRALLTMARTPMTHPGEQFYPQGVHWDDPIARGTLPDLLSKAAVDYGARPALAFPDPPGRHSEPAAKIGGPASGVLLAGPRSGDLTTRFPPDSPAHTL